jgi:hypothetical protein
MNFEKLRQYQNEIQMNIENVANQCRVETEKLSVLCRELSYTTPYSLSEAVGIVSNDLQNGMTYEDIIKKYQLEI